jgi:predicted transcriptional regulator
MKNMIFESELKVLEVLWKKGDTTAKELAVELKASTDWSKTTTYTVVKKCIDKGLIERLGTNFTCRAAITKEEAQKKESEILADKMFGGSSDLLIASLLGGDKMTSSQVDKLRNMVQKFADEQ